MAEHPKPRDHWMKLLDDVNYGMPRGGYRALSSEPLDARDWAEVHNLWLCFIQGVRLVVARARQRRGA